MPAFSTKLGGYHANTALQSETDSIMHHELPQANVGMLLSGLRPDPNVRYTNTIGDSGVYNATDSPRLSDHALRMLSYPTTYQRFLRWLRPSARAQVSNDDTSSVNNDRFLEEHLDSGGSKTGSVQSWPLPASIRDMILGGGARVRCSRLQTFAVWLIGIVMITSPILGLYAALMFASEASIIRTYGITAQSVNEDVFGYAYNSWSLLYVAYMLSALANFAEVCIGCCFTWQGPAQARDGTTVPYVSRLWMAASPETDFMPHGIRQLGFFLGDLMFAVGIVWIRNDLFRLDAFDEAPTFFCYNSQSGKTMVHVPANFDVTPWPGFERFYRERLGAGNMGMQVAFAGAIVRLVTAVICILAWDGLNSLYILPIGRFFTELFKRSPDPTNQAAEGSRRAADASLCSEYIAMQKSLRVLQQVNEQVQSDAKDKESAAQAPDAMKSMQYEAQSKLLLRTSYQAFLDAVTNVKTSVTSLTQLTDVQHPSESQRLQQLSDTVDGVIRLLPSTDNLVATQGEGLSSLSSSTLDVVVHAISSISNHLPDRIEIGTLYDGPKIMKDRVALYDEVACCGQVCCSGSCRCFASCAALWHNYLGSLRAWSIVNVVLLVVWVNVCTSSGTVGGLFPTSANSYTWPVYIPDAEAVKNHDIVPFRVSNLQGATYPSPPSAAYMAPPTAPATVMDEEALEIELEERNGRLLQDSTLAPPSESYQFWFPPPNCMERTSDDSMNAVLDLRFSGYIEDISRDNDSSSIMVAAAAILITAELFRLISVVAQLLGYIRNESSYPASHTRLSTNGDGSCFRTLFP